ncbi:hypothetical protein V2J09_024182 [Rumex salicifolius]
MILHSAADSDTMLRCFIKSYIQGCLKYNALLKLKIALLATEHGGWRVANIHHDLIPPQYGNENPTKLK